MCQLLQTDYDFKQYLKFAYSKLKQPVLTYKFRNLAMPKINI